MLVHTIFLQFDVLADVVDLSLQGDFIFFRARIHIFQHIHELHKCRFSPSNISQHQAVKRVESIEQKMWVYLDFIKSQLGFFLFMFNNLPFHNQPVQFCQNTHGKTKRQDNDIQKPHSSLVKVYFHPGLRSGLSMQKMWPPRKELRSLETVA